jgi:hypothetical protein
MQPTLYEPQHDLKTCYIYSVSLFMFSLIAQILVFIVCSSYKTIVCIIFSRFCRHLNVTFPSIIFSSPMYFLLFSSGLSCQTLLLNQSNGAKLLPRFQKKLFSTRALIGYSIVVLSLTNLSNPSYSRRICTGYLFNSSTVFKTHLFH